MSEDKPIRSLNADGTIDGPALGVPEPSQPEVEAAVLEEKIELVERVKNHIEYEDPPPYRPEGESSSNRKFIFVPLMLLLAIGIIGALSVFKPDLIGLKVAPKALIIMSEPAGALIFVGTQHLGVTPWAGNNIWSGTQTVTVKLTGFISQTRAFEGQKELSLHFELHKTKK